MCILNNTTTLSFENFNSVILLLLKSLHRIVRHQLCYFSQNHNLLNLLEISNSKASSLFLTGIYLRYGDMSYCPMTEV